MNLIQHGYRDNRDNALHYHDIGILIIAQPYQLHLFFILISLSDAAHCDDIIICYHFVVLRAE